MSRSCSPSPGRPPCARSPRCDSCARPRRALLHPADGGWIDGDGRATALPAGGAQAVTLVRADGADALAVVHRRGLLDDPRVVEELATTARLAVEHERLQASLRARLDQ